MDFRSKKVRKPDVSICSFGAAVMLKQLTAIQAELEGVLTASDMECIHRMRVASRRLRAAQEFFNPCLPRKTALESEKQIRSITRSLGEARDLDIQIDAFRKFQILAEQPSYQPGFKRLMLRLFQSRSQAQLKVLAAVKKFTTNPVIPQVQNKLTQFIPLTEKSDVGSTSLRLLAHHAISDKLESFLGYESYVHMPERKLELHAMRIAAKRLRYTLEIFAPIYPGEFKSWLRSIRQVQDQIGEIHDCDMWIDFLPLFLDTEKAFTMEYYGHSRSHNRIIPGIMIYHQNRQFTRIRLYEQFVDYWDSLQKKRTWQRLTDNLANNYPVEKTSVVEVERPVQELEVTNEGSPDQ
jgi:CHAD domain-containing protein